VGAFATIHWLVGTTFAVSAGTNTIRKTRTSSEMRPASQQARRFRVRQLPEATLVLYGLFASLVWEFGHSALYVDHAQRDTSYILWTRFHCSIGDVLILLGSFWWTSLWFRTRFWFVQNRHSASALFLLSGFAYTVWSEWYNTRIAHSWAYAPAMPTVFGIGLSPLAQWLVIPGLLVLLLRQGGSGRRLERLSDTGP